MLEGYISNGRIYFSPKSIACMQITPISYRDKIWKLSFQDHCGENHYIVEGNLSQCCERITEMSYGEEQ